MMMPAGYDTTIMKESQCESRRKKDVLSAVHLLLSNFRNVILRDDTRTLHQTTMSSLRGARVALSRFSPSSVYAQSLTNTIERQTRGRRPQDPDLKTSSNTNSTCLCLTLLSTFTEYITIYHDRDHHGHYYKDNHRCQRTAVTDRHGCLEKGFAV